MDEGLQHKFNHIHTDVMRFRNHSHIFQYMTQSWLNCILPGLQMIFWNTLDALGLLRISSVHYSINIFGNEIRIYQEIKVNIMAADA